MWVKVDDALPDHPKIIDAGMQLGTNGVGRVLAIWLKGMCYCNHNLTDGVIPRRVLRSWTIVDRRPLDVASVMVMAGIFKEEEHGYRFHDYTEYQPSKAKVTQRRKDDLARKRRKSLESASAQIPHGIGLESRAVPAYPALPDLSTGTHTKDHRADARDFSTPVENLRVLKALIWREVHAAAGDPDESFDLPSVTERCKVVAARSGLVYDVDFFGQHLEVAMKRVAAQRPRRAA